MTFKKYLKKLNDYAKKHPKSLELDVIYSKDDEGNAYYMVGDWDPAQGNYDSSDRDFESIEQMQEEGYTSDINAICIN